VLGGRFTAQWFAVHRLGCPGETTAECRIAIADSSALSDRANDFSDAGHVSFVSPLVKPALTLKAFARWILSVTADITPLKPHSLQIECPGMGIVPKLQRTATVLLRG
jgi:hypothetical protein